jgi:predicted RNase H-like nuclease (RuvC/YqgF family)
MEKTGLPILLKKKYGIDASVAEILEMLKQYKKAVDEGWCVEYAMEWGILSEEEREAFRELREKAYDKGLPVNEYIEGLKAKSGELSGENECLSRNVERLKREEKSLNERCSRLNRWLEEDYQSKQLQINATVL